MYKRAYFTTYKACCPVLKMLRGRCSFFYISKLPHGYTVVWQVKEIA